MNRDDYAYWLTVNGTSEEQKTVFEMLTEAEIIGEYLEPDGPDSAPYSHYCYPEDIGSGPEWYEKEMDDILHNIAVQVPNAILEIEAENVDNASIGFKKRFHGDLYQEVNLVVKMPPLLDGADIPFDQRNSNETIRDKIIRVERRIKVDEMVNNLCYNTDYDLLYAQKTALLDNLNHGTPIPKEALAGLVEFLDHAGDLGETLGRFQYDGIEPPFPLLPEYEKKIVVFPPEQEKMCALCEEYEDDNGIREFRILATSRDEEGLRKLMQAKIEKDEYGIIAQNGIDENEANHFRTEYSEGFIEYYITEEDVLTPEQIQTLLTTKEYDTTLHVPDGLEDLLGRVLAMIVTEKGYSEGDIDKGVQTLLADKLFQAELKDTHWFYFEKIANEQSAARTCDYFIRDQLKENPDYFSDLGIVPPFKAPENLSEALTDGIYDAAKFLQLKSIDVEDISASCLRNGKFRTEFTERFGTCERLDDAAMSQATAFCFQFLADMLKPKQRPGLDQIISNAAARTGNASEKTSEKDQTR